MIVLVTISGRFLSILLLLSVCMLFNFFALAHAENSSNLTQASIVGTRIIDVDGELQTIGGKEDTSHIVLLFLNADCPISRKYTPTLNMLNDLAVESNIEYYGVFSDPDVTLDEVKNFRDEFKLEFPVIFDASSDLALRLLPTITPEVFVLNLSDSIVYRGRIDNRFAAVGKQRTTITSHDLRDAIMAIAQSKLPESSYETPIGCFAPDWKSVKKHSLEQVNYNRHIAPILFANCTECHRQGEVAPFPLENYKHAKRWARMINYVTEQRIMPPWKPVQGFGKFKDERILSEYQIELLKSWASVEAPKGKESELLTTPVFNKQKWPLGKPDVVVKLKEPFHVPAEGEDIYRHFVVPSGFRKHHPTIGIDFRPSDPTVVHHALIMMDYSGRARKLDKEDPEPGFAVFGPGNFMNPGTSASFISGWVPGMKPFALPKGTAMWLPKDGDLLLQIHYHLTGKATQDQSEVAFYFQDEYPEHWISGMAIGTQKITIPPEETNHQIHFYMNVPDDFQLLEIAPHMHYLGKKVYAELTFPDGTKAPLIKIDDWDLRWQNRYTYRQPVNVPKGSRIDAWFTFDNSMENPANPSSVPQTVRWGLRSQDEMAQLWMIYIADYYSVNDIMRSSRVSWFRDALKLEVENDVNPFDELDVNEAIQVLKDKNQFIEEDNKVLNQAIDSARYEEIVTAFEQYVSENKNDISALTTYGYLLFTKAVFGVEHVKIFDYYKSSQKVFERALKLDSSNWRTRMSQATLYKHAPGEMGLTDDAIKIFSEILIEQENLPLRSNHAIAYKGLSYTYEQLGEYEKAAEVRKRALQHFPKDPYFTDYYEDTTKNNN